MAGLARKITLIGTYKFILKTEIACNILPILHMKIADGPARNKAYLIASLISLCKIMLLFNAAKAEVLRKQYPFGFVEIDKFFKLFAKSIKRFRIIHALKVLNPIPIAIGTNIRNPIFKLSYPKPVQQKEGGKHHTRDAIGSHKGKIYPAQVVWFHQAVLVDQHRAEE